MPILGVRYGGLPTSVFGPKQTFRVHRPMSVFEGKADIIHEKADICANDQRGHT
jgi:hypothetical protein